MSEQLSSFEQQREALAEKLKLREQYEQQIKTLNETGVLEILPESQELGIIGIDGKGYPIPTYEQILQRITTEKVELLTKKFEQGFTQLLLVPFGMPLKVLIDRYRRELLKHDSEGTLLSTDGQKLELDRENPIDIWENYQNADINGELVYDPQEFSQNHQGRTKIEILQEKGAWQIILSEDLTDLPGEGQGKTIKGRHQFEANQQGKHYLWLMQANPQYQGEKGFSPESWLTLAITHLQAKNQVIDNWKHQSKVCFLTGSYFEKFDRLPLANWLSDDRQAVLDVNHPGTWFFKYSTRSRVEI
jgi:hypothetical protein